MTINEFSQLGDKMWILYNGCLIDTNEIVAADINHKNQCIEVILKGKTKQINIPFKTTEIGEQCFSDCRNLTKIEIQCEQIPQIASTTFLNVSEEIKIYFENESVLETYKNNPAWNAFADKFVIAE